MQPLDVLNELDAELKNIDLHEVILVEREYIWDIDPELLHDDELFLEPKEVFGILVISDPNVDELGKALELVFAAILYDLKFLFKVLDRVRMVRQIDELDHHFVVFDSLIQHHVVEYSIVDMPIAPLSHLVQYFEHHASLRPH